MKTEKTRLLRVRDVAIAAIQHAKKPIGTKEIWMYARENGLATLFKGKTPRQSIQATVWKDINENGSKSPFVMIGPGRNTRKYWLRDKWLQDVGHLSIIKHGGQLRKL